MTDWRALEAKLVRALRAEDGFVIETGSHGQPIIQYESYYAGRMLTLDIEALAQALALDGVTITSRSPAPTYDPNAGIPTAQEEANGPLGQG